MRERIEIQLDPESPIEMSILAIIDAIGARNNHSRSKVTKGILLLFAPAAAAIDDLDLTRQQQRIVSRLLAGEIEISTPLPVTPTVGAGTPPDFAPIQGF